jgi:hypothetical protein
MLRDSTIVFIIAAACIVGLALMSLERTNYNKAPKIIWTYWDNPGKIPNTVKMCMEGWKKYNPDYKIILLTPENYKGYINIPLEIASHYNLKDSPARFSDLLRLWALTEHGGIWCDSSIILKGPINDWLFPKYAEFSGFYIDSFTKIKNTPVIESWFLAANKGSQFIKKWRDEFTQMANFIAVKDYIESRRKMGVDFQGISDPHYLAIHIAAQKVLQIDKYPIDSLILKKAEDGPFKYLVEAKWDSGKALQLACSNQKYQAPIMKMRGDERNELEKRIEFDLSPEICGWV